MALNYKQSARILRQGNGGNFPRGDYAAQVEIVKIGTPRGGIKVSGGGTIRADSQVCYSNEKHRKQVYHVASRLYNEAEKVIQETEDEVFGELGKIHEARARRSLDAQVEQEQIAQHLTASEVPEELWPYIDAA